jgi:hypothetical protein
MFCKNNLNDFPTNFPWTVGSLAHSPSTAPLTPRSPLKPLTSLAHRRPRHSRLDPACRPEIHRHSVPSLCRGAPFSHCRDPVLPGRGRVDPERLGDCGSGSSLPPRRPSLAPRPPARRTRGKQNSPPRCQQHHRLPGMEAPRPGLLSWRARLLCSRRRPAGGEPSSGASSGARPALVRAPSVLGLFPDFDLGPRGRRSV